MADVAAPAAQAPARAALAAAAAGRRFVASLSRERFRAQLPMALAELERGSGGELQALLDARLGALSRASVDDVLAAGREGQGLITDALSDVLSAAELLGTPGELLRDVRGMLGAVSVLRRPASALAPSAAAAEAARADGPVPLDLAPRALLTRVQRLRADGAERFRAGDTHAAAVALERAWRLLRPYEERWTRARGHQAAEQLRASHLGVVLNLALCYLRGPQEPLRALECCREALVLEPGHATATLRRVQALKLLGLAEHADLELVGDALAPCDLRDHPEMA